MLKKIARSSLFYFLSGVAVLVFSGVFIGVLVNSVNQQWMIFPCMAIMLIVYALCTRKNDSGNYFRYCFVAMVIIQLFFGYFLMVEYANWDVYAVVKSARALVNDTYYDAEYFARYPNNIGLMLLFAGVFSITDALWSSTSVYYLVVLNIIAIDISIIMLMRTIKLLYGKELSYRIGTCLTLFAPLYLYVVICYTDTFVMPFLTGAAYLIVRTAKTYNTNSFSTNTLIAFALGVLVMLGMKIKATMVIVLIAAILYWLHMLKWKNLLHVSLAIFGGMLTISLIYGYVIEPISGVTPEMRDQCQFPLWHWIMMGLEDLGNFNSALTKYTASFATYAERVTANLDKIGEQINSLGLGGVLKQFYKKAVDFGWNYGTFYAERYIGDFGDMPRLKNILHEFFLSQGQYHDGVYVVTQSMWLIYMGFTMIGFIKNILRKDYNKFFMHLLVIGCMLFFMLWETHPRYILHYSVFVVASGVLELDAVVEWGTNRGSRFVHKLMKGQNDRKEKQQ